MEPSENKITLGQLPVGGRLIVRSRVDWRVAVIARQGDEKTTLTVASAKGRCYRLSRSVEADVDLDGCIAVLRSEAADNWRENLLQLDHRW
ncbi:MAG: hypothetical protein QUS14_10220 [Pyrinomonadaceae bacterium]|nr:hypothetical protein [Pyrinomonadaceae bacterium]